MPVTMMLADAAQAANGKIHILGGGWSVTGSPTAPTALVIKTDVPWGYGNDSLAWLLELVDADGRPPAEAQIRLDGHVDLTRPDGLPIGTPLDLPMVFHFPPLPLVPGRYEWRFSIGDEHGYIAFWVTG